jgi:hypothetical protein
MLLCSEFEISTSRFLEVIFFGVLPISECVVVRVYFLTIYLGNRVTFGVHG